MEEIPGSNLFYLSENGFLIISALLGITIIIGILLALSFFRKNLTGKKLMLFGAELIFLGLIFNAIVDYKVRYPSLSFLTILLGAIISVIGLLSKD
ncbi:hypothetical protein NSS79_11515 [Paenibacillus sp. FSL L8-0436]|uniref:hypothetical protein n=1 Tax=Paenibacillus sp. FSL L8-0436 TaxID=2954686 RepID=UPI00315849F7